VDVPTNITVGQNGVQSIQTLPYGSGASAVARIIIMYDKPVQTDILTDGNNIVVRQAEAPPAPAAAPVVAKAAPTPPKPAQQAAPPPPSPTPAPEPPAPRLAAAVPPSPRPAAAEPAVAPPPPAQPPRNAESAAPPPPPPPAETVAEAPSPPPAEEPVAPSPEPVAPAAVQEPNAPPAAPPAPSPQSAPVVARTEAAAPVRLNAQARLASPPPPTPTEEPPRVTARRKTLSLVGLRFNNGGTSVFVRTNEPVSYRVSERPNGLVITIENTRIRRRNDTRPLDAEYFDTPVAKVRASQNRGDVEVNIDLKAHAAYQATQTGPEVELSFSKQG
jgi:colicin import membrane protein